MKEKVRRLCQQYLPTGSSELERLLQEASTVRNVSELDNLTASLWEVSDNLQELLWELEELARREEMQGGYSGSEDV